jgi:inosose dehydratase
MNEPAHIPFTIGCFALNTPFAPLSRQLQEIKQWGFNFADVTDNSDGACLGSEFGFSALASLDANPHDLARLFGEHGLRISAFCAHANLLDPSAPWRYGNAQIVKAVRSAAAIGVKHVITTEGDPHTLFGRSLSETEALFIVREKLHEPLRVALDHGVQILLEPHGPLTANLNQIERLLDVCDSPALGLNLDTGNLWLGGADPVEFVQRFGRVIQHVHWKDLPAEFSKRRGTMFGCGMSTIPLGEGVVGIEAILHELKKVGFNRHTTLEIAGEDAVIRSRDYLLARGGRI